MIVNYHIKSLYLIIKKIIQNSHPKFPNYMINSYAREDNNTRRQQREKTTTREDNNTRRQQREKTTTREDNNTRRQQHEKTTIPEEHHIKIKTIYQYQNFTMQEEEEEDNQYEEIDHL